MSTNIISINRGDSYCFDLTISDDGSENGIYELKEDDAIYFGLMDPHQPFEFALVKKKYTSEDVNENGGITVEIKPEDTLDLFPGRYYYMIKLHAKHHDEDGNLIDAVQTVINKTIFVIYD